jgi:hypothetical protein
LILSIGRFGSWFFDETCGSAVDGLLGEKKLDVGFDEQ